MESSLFEIHYRQALALFDLGLEKPYILYSLDDFLDFPAEKKPLTFLVDECVAKMPHEESGETFVDLNAFLLDRKSDCVCAHGVAKYGAQDGNMKLRKSVAEKLVMAEQFLKSLSGEHLSLKITDAHRPMALQRLYYDQILREIEENEGLTGTALYEKAGMYISPPHFFPPHTTGGAIDLTILDLNKQQELDMGSQIDDTEDKVMMFYSKLSHEQKENRARLFASMLSAGFVNFPAEWWHYSYGDKEWAMRSQKPHAIYTPQD